MPRLIWSPSALSDVQRLYRFLAVKSPNAAQRAAQAIYDGVLILEEQPEIGRPVENMEPEYREWLINFGNSGYTALYHYDGETAMIVAVKHQLEVAYSDH